MPVYTFELVRVRRQKNGKCPVCGRRVTRSHVFEQTVNPFNKRPDGTPKTREEVWEAVADQADAWEPDFTHAKCEAEANHA